jgi:hypothetical protein
MNRYSALLQIFLPVALTGLALLVLPAPCAGTSDDALELNHSTDGRGEWMEYAHRYAIVVMGGNVTGQMYRWYWNDTSGEVWTLMDWGFAPEDIIYLTYGDSAAVHPELVDGVSNYADVEAAFASIAEVATPEDLVHVWWVDHGSPSGFQVHDGFVYFTTLREWIDAIDCRVYLGAYNPCFSGAIIPHMAGLCTETRRVISATSVNASQGNSYGWAGKWRFALRGGCPDSYVPNYTDTNHDGYIAWDEAYEWETPHSNANGEYPLFDDNCDGIGGDFRNPATYDSSGQNSAIDGYHGQFYTLMAWYDDGLRPSVSPPLSRLASRADSRPIEIAIAWSAGAPLPAPVARGASGLIGDEIYLFGGYPTPAPVHFRYDIESDTWSTDPAPIPVPGSLVRGVVHDEGLYVFGGHTLGCDDIRRYDAQVNAWEVLNSPFPDGWRECCKYGAAEVSGQICYYYVEERYSYEPLLGAWMYDISSDSWSEGTLPPSPERMYVASASDADYCYAIGGIAHDSLLSVLPDAIRCDFATGEWTQIEPLPEPVAFADGDFLKGHLFIAGGGAGHSRWPASDRVHVWHEGRGWMAATPLPAPVGCPHVELATIGQTDYIFVFGGYNEGYLNTLYIGEILWGQGVEDDAGSVPCRLRLSVTSPTSFGGSTAINYLLPMDCWVRLTIHDVLGRDVATLVNEMQTAGRKTTTWDWQSARSDAGSACTGVYFCRLKAGDAQMSRRMLRVR